MGSDPDWPKPGDRLVREDLPDCQHNACICKSSGDVGGWTCFVDGYREVADWAVTALIERQGTLDTWCYPVLFLYRHHFELQLKTVIKLGENMFDEEERLRGHHKLLPLWAEARIYIERHWRDQPHAEHPVIDICFTELNTLDEGSYAFRYPVDKDGSHSIPDVPRINLRNFAQVAIRISNYLSSCIAAMWCHLHQKLEIESCLRSEYEDGGW